MGNACSCVLKNKLPNKEENNIKILQNEVNEDAGNPNIVKEEEIKKDLNNPVEESQMNNLSNTIEENQMDEKKHEVDQIFPDPPEDFKPDLVDAVDKDVIPLENEIPNEESFSQPEKHLDELAIDIGKHSFSSFISLIYYLIYQRSDGVKCNDYQKVCALFTWLTAKNLHELKFSNESPPADSPEEMLLGVSTGKTAYAQVFQMLCRYAGLQCKLIRGYAKGVDYKLGMQLEGSKVAQHGWNAVKIDNNWFLFDCHWAARRLTGKPTSDEKIKTNLDLFYFMTNPSQLIYTHFPFEDEWQLSKNKMTLEQFQDIALVKPTFFKYKLELYSHNQAVLEVQEKLVLMLKLPLDLADKISITFTLTLEGLGEIYEGSNLTRFGIQETNTKTGLCTLNFRFPKSGSYKLLIYGREHGDQIFGGICEYKVNAKLPEKEIIDKNGEKHMEEDHVVPYPPTQQSSYGKTEMAYQYNIKCTIEDSSIIRISHGEFEVSFFREDKDEDNFPQLIGRLKSSFHEDNKLISRLLQRNTYEKNVVDKVIILAFLPDAGEYALEIYAKNPQDEGSSYFLVWQIFVYNERGCELPLGLPDINPGGAIGSQPEFQELGLGVLSHPDPYITVSNKHNSKEDETEHHDLTVSISLPQSSSIKVLGQLVDLSLTEEEKDYTEYLLQQNILQDKEFQSISFHLRFIKSGCFYKLHIYGAPSTSDVETLPMVFSYLINAPHRLSSSDVPYFGIQEGSYPCQLSQWKEKCRLFEPINKKIKTDKENQTVVQFTVQIPDACHVAVFISGENFFQLSNQNEDNFIWSGEVTIEPTIPVDSKVTVCACYSDPITSYSTLLEYQTC